MFWPVTSAGQLYSFSASFSYVSASSVPFQPVLVVFRPVQTFSASSAKFFGVHIVFCPVC
jgi:hypothetical protein